MDIANTLKREVYRNLRYRDEHVYSVRKDGLVEGTALCVVMDGIPDKKPVKFAVGDKGCQRVRDEERKNVHAVIRGYIINAVWRYDGMDAFELGWANDAAKEMKEREMDKREGYDWMEVTYNPYEYRTFVSIDRNPFRTGIKDVIEPIFTARKVIITDKVWAQVKVEHEEN